MPRLPHVLREGLETEFVVPIRVLFDQYGNMMETERVVSPLSSRAVFEPAANGKQTRRLLHLVEFPVDTVWKMPYSQDVHLNIRIEVSKDVRLNDLPKRK